MYICMLICYWNYWKNLKIIFVFYNCCIKSCK
jgi:hypothetical protein